MNLGVRRTLDRIFTGLTGASIVLLALVLIAVLGPMVYRGSSAVFFTGTIEFRKMQRDLFNRGDRAALADEVAKAQASRQVVYDMVDRFKKGIDIDALSSKVRDINREYGRELRYKEVSPEEYTESRGISRTIRDMLEEAFSSQDIDLIKEKVAEVMKHEDDARFKDTAAARFFTIARDFLAAVEHIDLSKYHDYLVSLEDVEVILFGSIERPGLLGPRPEEPSRSLAMVSYGATRWSQAESLLDRLLWTEQWVEKEPGQPLVKERTPRADLFKGTALEPLFTYVPEHLKEMLQPRFTAYWQFFVDDNVDSHYFGGVGPEMLGTLLITLLGMLFVVPLGVISAAYLVECASEGWIIRIIRMSINTLAGVPSIVFGLFGLAFFVLFLFPLLGFEPRDCILSASLTLAVLTLPVMIRASEEAIRTVPQSYKEGSLALGASRFRTFVTVTLPAALPGILTGVILSLSRIAGETAPILFTGAVSQGPIPKSIFDRTRTLSYGSYDMAVGDRLAMMVPHNQYGMVVTLIMLILILNAMAIVLRSRVFKKLKGH